MSYKPNRSQLSPSTIILDRIRQGFQFNTKSIVDAVVGLRRFSFRLNSNYDLASSIFVSKITKLSDVKDCTCLRRNEVLTLHAYIDKTNFETEEKIYDVYAQLLELFPDTNIDVRVTELHGRTKDEINAEW